MGKRWCSGLRRVFSCKEKEKEKNKKEKLKKKKWGVGKPKEKHQGVFGHEGDSKSVLGVLGSPALSLQLLPSSKKISALCENGNDLNDYSMVIATAAAAEAVAPCAAAEVVRLTTSLRSPDGLSREEIAATKVQNAFRVHLLGEDWNDSPQSKEQMKAKLRNRHVAALKRERTSAYAYSHQWSNSSRSKDPTHDPHGGWSWLMPRMPARSCEDSRSAADRNRLSNRSCILTSSRALSCRLSHLLPSTPPSIKGKSSRARKTCSAAEDDMQSQLSFWLERHTIGGALGVRDDESVVSSSPVPGYLSSTVSSRAKSRFQTPGASKSFAGTPAGVESSLLPEGHKLNPWR